MRGASKWMVKEENNSIAVRADERKTDEKKVCVVQTASYNIRKKNKTLARSAATTVIVC